MMNSCPRSRSAGQDAVIAVGPQAGQADPVHEVHGRRSSSSRAAILTVSAFAGTSCTRTHHAPAMAAYIVSAAVASSHSANGRGVSWPRAEESRDEPLARRTDEDREGRRGMIQAADLAEPAQQRPAVAGELGEAEAGIDDQLSRVDARGGQRRHALRKLGRDLLDDVGVDGPVLHVHAVAAPVHDDVRDP